MSRYRGNEVIQSISLQFSPNIKVPIFLDLYIISSRLYFNCLKQLHCLSVRKGLGLDLSTLLDTRH